MSLAQISGRLIESRIFQIFRIKINFLMVRVYTLFYVTAKP